MEADAIELIRLMIKHGARVNDADRLDHTALHYALEQGHHYYMSLLLKNGASVSQVDRKGQSILFYAADAQDITAIRMLIAAGARVDQKDYGGETALLRAASHGSVAGVQELIRAGASPAVVGPSGGLAAAAVASGRPELVRYVLTLNLPLNTRDHEGQTPLIRACRSRHKELAMLLIEAGARVDIRDRDGRLALDWATEHGDVKLAAALENPPRRSRR